MHLSLLLSLHPCICGSVWAQSQVAEAYLSNESPIAKVGVLANIGHSGSKSQGAKDGVVIASPSSNNPDYLYTWTRDSSLVFQMLIDQYTLGLDKSLRSHIDSFVGSQRIIQQVSNPSGTVSSGGLGEPKFHIDESAFTSGWGRPQRDGPALRANALMTWGNFLISEGNASYVSTELWPIIKLDLDYVSSNWNKTTFDLWEEVSSSSFFTTAVQQRSLRQGAAFSKSIGKTTSDMEYLSQADDLLCFMQTYWNSAGYMTANTGGGRSGKDANAVLASIHTFDAAAGCDSLTFQPCSDRALSNLFTYVNAFHAMYPINSRTGPNQGLATGRYPEDSYMGGNPWYLTTLAVAEQLYDALIVWKELGVLNVTAISQPFFTTLCPGVEIGTYESSTTVYPQIMDAVKDYADSFVAVVAKYTPSDGGLAEQYSRHTGMPTSAVDLTWSYASLLTAFDARAGIVPASWGADGLGVTPSCVRGGGGGGGGGGEVVAVTFAVHATTIWGENIFLTGSIDVLKNWSPIRAIPLSADTYPIWKVTVNIPANTPIEYKYIRKYKGGIKWESDPNMQFTTPSSGSYTKSDNWR